jgi:hypothetical protein
MKQRSNKIKLIMGILMSPINALAFLGSIIHIINIRASKIAIKVNTKLESLEKGNNR